MKNYKIQKVLLGALLIAGLSSCNTEQVGPDICPSEDFTFTAEDLKVDILSGSTITELSSTDKTVDLSSGGLHIHGSFSEVVTWELKIVNDVEQRTYSGESSDINIYWYGQGDRFNEKDMSFAEGAASIEFEVICSDVIKKDFIVSGVQSFTEIDSSFGVLIRDWDKNGLYPVALSNFSVADGWAGSGGGANPWEFDYYNTISSPAGGRYAQFYGKTSAPSWYMGGTSFPTGGIENILPTSNTDSLYLNIFVKADEDLPNCGSQVGFQSDNVNYLISEDITWKGWKLVSHKLSEYKSPSGDPLTSTEIANMVLQIGSQPEAVNELRVMYDFALITYGEPLFKK